LLKGLRELFLQEETSFVPSAGEINPVMLGRFASSALKNPAFDAAFKAIEADILNAWKTSTPKDAEAREKLYYRIEGLALIKVKLQGMINNMMFEENSRQSERKRKQGEAE
jgi:hypothetical protein